MRKVHLPPPIDRDLSDYEHIIPDGKNSAFIGKALLQRKGLFLSEIRVGMIQLRAVKYSRKSIWTNFIGDIFL